MQGNRNIAGLADAQLGMMNQTAELKRCAQPQNQMGSAPPPAGVLDLIAGAHDAVAALQQSIGALEIRLGGVLRAPFPEEGSGDGVNSTVDAPAVESLRGLLTRISQTTAMVNVLHDRVQV